MRKEAQPRDRFPVRPDPEMVSNANRAKAWPKNMTKSARTRILKHAKSVLAREKFDAGDLCWGPIPGLPNKFQSRYQIMAYIVDMISETGCSLLDLIEYHCMDRNEWGAAFPNLQEVKRWTKVHPAFMEALKDAEECRGEHLGELSLTVALEAPEDEDPRKTKLKHEALFRHAGLLNKKFQTKQLTQVEDVTEKLTREQLLQQLEALMGKHPEIKGAIEAEVIQESPLE